MALPSGPMSMSLLSQMKELMFTLWQLTDISLLDNCFWLEEDVFFHFVKLFVSLSNLYIPVRWDEQSHTWHSEPWDTWTLVSPVEFRRRGLTV